MVEHSKYLIVGGSHAALEALAAIRMVDADGDVTLLARDSHLPYSPTVLPYVVSGRSNPERVNLRDAAYFERQRAAFLPGATVESVHPQRSAVTLADGAEIRYDKLLLATGAAPAVPPIMGLAEVPYRVLRTLDDALALREAAAGAKRAVVLGAGLVGMHAAENLAHAGADVTVVEMQRQLLPGYFDEEAGELIDRVFSQRGVKVLTGTRVTGVAPRNGGCHLRLASGEALDADLLLVATGVAPVMGYLEGSGIATDRGVLVDDTMATNVPNVWAAGDVAQATSFYTGAKVVGGILPAAVEQGRIAGAAMAGDSGVTPWPGGVPLNTYTFFGNQAVSVGIGEPPEDAQGVEVIREYDSGLRRYLKIVLHDNRLLGIFAINRPLDGGVMWQLILNRTDLGPVKEQFLARPLETGRVLMSKIWR